MSEDERDREPGSARAVFLWAALGHPNTPPDRLEVVTCPRCGALIPIDSEVPHAGWHARREDRPDQMPGVACSRCGRLDGPMAPTGQRSSDGVQLFACVPRCL